MERLEQHAARLAATQKVRSGRSRGRSLASRLADNGRVLLETYRKIAEVMRDERAITPAAEWLVDNFHLVEEQLREIREDLPPGFYRELPKLIDEPFQGYPRVYALAHDFVTHTDSLFDAETLRRFIRAYQRQENLTLGELWAVAISLRVVLVENLRRLAERMARDRVARVQAEDLADRLLNGDPLAPLRRYETGTLEVPFVVVLLGRLRDQDPVVTPALAWLNRRLAEQNATADEILELEYSRQSAMNTTVRNVITSMRSISAFDWAAFVESVSLVEEELKAHPGYQEMDFATRDRYRHAVEELARGARLAETEVASRAVQRAAGPPAAGPYGRPADPGYDLIGNGRPAFERELGCRLPPGRLVGRAFLAWATPGYLGTIAAGTALILALPLWLQHQQGTGGWTLLALGLLALVPASELAVQLLNSRVMRLVGPRVLPRLELRGGIPTKLRTLVAVPTLLTAEAEIEEQINRLEVHYLANPEAELRFALLSDWSDAPDETMPGDDELLATAIAGIARLNAQHGPAPAGDARFLLFHRRRVWSASEQCWLGWERKRGKLEELNRLLRGAQYTSFLPGAVSAPPPEIRYVLTLDADTRLPREAARRLAGTLAHPLNRPRYDPAVRRVVSGYGILQPRITPTLPDSHEGSLFQRVFSGPAGIDPYAAAVSDIYQDLYGEGSYTGKGIYDVDAFTAALDGKVPESRMLSHDLFEGIFARAGLVTDIELFEEFPAHFEAAAARQHRWARGDWQLLPWILGRGPAGSDRKRDRAPIPIIGRYKMLDNLRRTLVAPAAFLTLLAGWTLRGASPALWTLFVLATMILPAFFGLLPRLWPRRTGISKRSHLRGVASDILLSAAQEILSIVFLAHFAWLMADAILRTLARLYVTRRRMLEWVTAAQSKAGLGLDLSLFYRRMDGGITFAMLAAGLVVVAAKVWLSSPTPGSWPAWVWSAPLLLSWGLAPVVARWISLPPPVPEADRLSAEEAQSLRLLARRTWRFFETFVGAEDHALPPDNFQEDPKPVVAHRTSPTNLGLYLLATVAARDFGWLGTLECVERLEATLATMGGLERFRGHFFNWYDTRTVQPLEPRYVSTVDSGNLAGHLVALAEACRQLAESPARNAQALSGIADAVALIRLSAPASAGRRTQTVTRRQLDEALDALGLPASPSHSEAPEPPQELTDDWARRLRELSDGLRAVEDVARALAGEQKESADAENWNEVLAWAELAAACVASHIRDLGAVEPESAAEALAHRLLALCTTASALSAEMEFGFLFDPSRKLFAIGYRVAEGELDPSFYDLLASEARLASFIAIAKGDVPVQHWFQLGRPLTPVDRGAVLISWSGSMFEYLMPALVMRSPAHSLLDQTCRGVVRRQIQYGNKRGVPWGVSESAFNGRDLELTYQYSNFGVPGLGLKRGLSEDVVVAPYATVLAAMFEPRAALRNFTELESAGAAGRFGFYEAIDYTAARLPEGQDLAVVRAYMAHHQGMSLLSLANVLDVCKDGGMPARFHAVPLVQATELLLQERTPHDVAVARPRAEEVAAAVQPGGLAPPVVRRFTSPHQAVPRSHLLGNGRYTVMITAAGSGYSRFRGGPDHAHIVDVAVTRYREDTTRDCWGSYIFLRDAQSGEVWSAGYQPSGVEPDSYEVSFSEDRAEIVRRDRAITCRLEVVVAQEDDAELRRVSLTNHGARAREIELTSYAEIVLAPQAADVAHPAFSNLFVETEWDAHLGALLASRRPRSASEPRIWAAHVAASVGASLFPEWAEMSRASGVSGVSGTSGDGTDVQYETDRARFLGRGRGVRTPMSVIDGSSLSNTAGAVLDPIFCLRRRIRLAPGTTARVLFSTLVTSSRETALDLADKYRDPAAFERATTMAWTQAQVQLRHLGILPDEANLFQRLANRVLYADPSLRPAAEVLQSNVRGASALWPFGISGDLPIVLVRIDEIDDMGIVRQLLKAHEYFRIKRLMVDLVILNERAPSYVQDLQGALEALVRSSQSHLHHEGQEPHGNAYILRADLLSPEVRGVLLTAARVVLKARDGSLFEQIELRARAEERRALSAGGAGGARRAAGRGAVPAPAPSAATAGTERPRIPLEMWNGLGGFTADGSEYVTILGAGQWTPAPWVNVISNPNFGFQVSESGAGFTWSVNSRENQLTPWSNDPVSDPPGETFYVRDEESGLLWGPTVLPIREEAWPYVARHGQGYSRFEHTSHGVTLELLQYVPPADPVKISRLTIINREDRPRKLTVTAYAEWVLGTSRSASAPVIVTALDKDTGAILARNVWNPDFGSRVAFADLNGWQTSWTADRAELLGRNGTPDHPAALERRDYRLSGRVGAALDPCAALQTAVDLRPGARIEVLFLLGQGENIEEVHTLIRRYRTADLDAVLAEVTRSWNDVTGALQVKTPDQAMDLLLNRWLLYQTLSCRLWSRTAFYQAGGAFGFRDQLQDVMALTVARREITREQILRAASRQFVEGDVQHWWHPPTGRGVRTHISDDLLWLPYVVLQYLDVTGETALLDEDLPFLEGPLLPLDQEDAYFVPSTASQRGTLFEHCARALDLRLPSGSHGLPLMGTGDWNDGMNRIGRQGKGESVWLGWFLQPLLVRFAEIAAGRTDTKDRQRAEVWRYHAGELKTALEASWDGDWYRRAYFDDGTPVGSATSDECQIDSIAQSWAVLSGAADPEHAKRSMESVDKRLVRRDVRDVRDQGHVLLFTPPFDKTPLDPGYIKGYLPGVRENGGQYTHAAVWCILAFAALGDGDRATELFSILNPINHGKTRSGVQRYKVEPYVIAGDVYAEPTHLGRGGWTWYTGSAGWMYRAGIESILGFRLRGTTLTIDPTIPRTWPTYDITFRYHAATYTITVENPNKATRGVATAELDGTPLEVKDGKAEIGLIQDGQHTVRVVLGSA